MKSKKVFAHSYPPGHPLHGYTGPDPRTVALCLPIGDFKPDWEYVTGILQCMPFFARPITYCGCSMVSQARNVIAHRFLHNYEKELEWAVWIDADIGFFPMDWNYLMEGDDKFVIAPYSKKSKEGVTVRTGFGFNKVHRSVFEAIDRLTDGEGKEVARRFFFQSAMMTDFFPSGATGFGDWQGEDEGFIMLARLAGFEPVLEERCDLTHFGRYGYKINRG